MLLSRKGQKKMKYKIYCKDVFIGLLEISDDERRHKYTPYIDGVEVAKKLNSLSHEMVEASDWRDPIPFFKNRIENAKRFSDGKVIKSHTDFIKMVLDE